jgi:hypothetical protein
VPALVGGTVGAAAVGLLLNITAGAIDPSKVPAILHWGWFGMAVYFPLCLVYISPTWNWLANSWRRSASKPRHVLFFLAISALYLVGANLGILWAWRHLAPHPVVTEQHKPDVGPASVQIEAPKTSAVVPEVVITAPRDYIYNLTWIPKKDLIPRTTAGANYDPVYLEVHKLPLFPPVSVVAVTASWSVVAGVNTKSIFQGSSHFADFGVPTVGVESDSVSMFRIGESGAIPVADAIQTNRDAPVLGSGVSI